MNENTLKNCKVAILATDGFEESELFEPLHALQAAGAEAQIVSIKTGRIKAWNHDRWGKDVDVELLVSEANPDNFDALLLPGGVMNPDKLRMSKDAVNFVRRFAEDGKPIAAICHGAWTLAEADVVRGRRMTSYPSIKTDLKNAGAIWEDSEVVTDQGLVTSRSPADLSAFNRKMLEEFAEGPHRPRERRKRKEESRGMSY